MLIRKNKYNAKASCKDGFYFASNKEKEAYLALKELVISGDISDLEMQPKFPIIIEGKQVCRYRADFQFFDHRLDPPRIRVIDVKGMDTEASKLRRRLAEAAYHIIVEIW